MQVAGAMGWAPSAFWRATPREFRVAMEGWLLSRGVKIETAAARERRRTRMDGMRDYMAQFCRSDG